MCDRRIIARITLTQHNPYIHDTISFLVYCLGWQRLQLCNALAILADKNRCRLRDKSCKRLQDRLVFDERFRGGGGGGGGGDHLLHG